MASETKRVPVALSSDWQDLCAVFTDIVNLDVIVQSKGTSVAVVFGGSTAPASDAANLSLAPGETVPGNCDHIWVRGSGTVTVHVVG